MFLQTFDLGKLRDWGGREARKEADVGSGRSHFKGPNSKWTSAQVGMKRGCACLRRVQVTQDLPLEGGGTAREFSGQPRVERPLGTKAGTEGGSKASDSVS